MILTLLSGVFISTGIVFCLLGSIGVLRLPDYFSRIHAAGMIDTLGAGSVLVGLMLIAGLSLVSLKLLLIFVFILITGPTASHALARAALHDGYRPKLDQEDTVSNKS